MKRVKDKIKNLIGILPILILELLPFIVLGLGLLIAYLIATSNLPDWFKFFLLR